MQYSLIRTRSKMTLPSPHQTYHCDCCTVLAEATTTGRRGGAASIDGMTTIFEDGGIDVPRSRLFVHFRSFFRSSVKILLKILVVLYNACVVRGSSVWRSESSRTQTVGPSKIPVESIVLSRPRPNVQQWVSAGMPALAKFRKIKFVVSKRHHHHHIIKEQWMTEGSCL